MALVKRSLEECLGWACLERPPVILNRHGPQIEPAAARFHEGQPFAIRREGVGLLHVPASRQGLRFASPSECVQYMPPV